MQTSFYSLEELKELGFRSIGQNVLISRKCSIYGADKMIIGNNVRIDDFCILSGTITLGNNIHIAAYCALYGGEGIRMRDYSGLSAKVIIYSVSDDFQGESLIGACVPDEHRILIRGEVILEKFVQLGAGTIVMPQITIGVGTVTGAMSLVRDSLEPWGIYVGIPAKRIKERSKNLLKFI